jgi:hypothetical protein
MEGSFYFGLVARFMGGGLGIMASGLPVRGSTGDGGVATS